MNFYIGEKFDSVVIVTKENAKRQSMRSMIAKWER